MGQHSAISKDKLASGLLLGAVAGLAITALSSAGTASATCASISGVGNSADCTSTPTSFAIGLGSGTTATAQGMFDGAIANGVTNTGTQFTSASSVGNLSLAYAGGPNTIASANGNLNLAVAQGSGVQAQAGFGGVSPPETGNVAFNIANEPTLAPANNIVGAGFGNGNVAANLGGTSSTGGPNVVQALGKGNVATNFGGTGNEVFAGSNPITGIATGTSNTAFAVGGTNNAVFAGNGPFNVAGEINQTGGTFVNNIH